jgi:hypothetical protein
MPVFLCPKKVWITLVIYAHVCCLVFERSKFNISGNTEVGSTAAVKFASDRASFSPYPSLTLSILPVGGEHPLYLCISSNSAEWRNQLLISNSSPNGIISSNETEH